LCAEPAGRQPASFQDCKLLLRFGLIGFAGYQPVKEGGLLAVFVRAIVAQDQAGQEQGIEGSATG